VADQYSPQACGIRATPGTVFVIVERGKEVSNIVTWWILLRTGITPNQCGTR